MPNISSSAAPRDPLLDPLPEIKVIDLEPDIQYIFSYKDSKNDLTLIRYVTGECKILGISPAVLQEFDKSFNPDKPFRFI